MTTNLEVIRTLEPAAAPASSVSLPSSDPVAHAWDGRPIYQISEEDLDADAYFQFQRMATQNKKNPDEAMRWLMIRLFTLGDCDRMTLDHISGKPSQNPQCIGFKALAILGTLTGQFVSGMPSGKDSSTSADLQDGV
ncbi:hypothetical protein [Pseudanabaena sp. FACHB-2040]|uniref:hypothetical protein n=1 Tax=Pseudanabaena sp. FACHB-2040 TaxID=2692859 RepID=UPI0016860F17|nr:hypothetical protein [Pseudanabaena sp. FACHB-2040]MBD2261374.1 hypothetical protein [Pseudanabaena sp. FACHB-2040]